MTLDTFGMSNYHQCFLLIFFYNIARHRAAPAPDGISEVEFFFLTNTLILAF